MVVDSLSSWLRGQENIYQSVRLNVSTVDVHQSTAMVFDIRALGLYLCRFISSPLDLCGNYSQFAATARAVRHSPVALTSWRPHPSSYGWSLLS